jgi:NAD(P)-dependent dehydrogenase (short-subunit alcohol dehydrogenase family)
MAALEGKSAIVVGGGSGIGRDVLEEFLAQGAQVAVLEISSDKCAELTHLGSRVLALQGDATLLADNQRVVQGAIEAFGRIDILATFVGVFDFYTRLADLPDESIVEAFEEIFRLNVLSYMLSVKAVASALRDSKGSIVLTLSTSSFYPGRGGPLYIASKYACRGLVAALAHEFAPEVRVNGVAPGGTRSTELRGLTALGMQDRNLGAIPERQEDLRKRNPLGLALSGRDHAGAYVFLASDMSRGTTGTIVHSDGGIGIAG